MTLVRLVARPMLASMFVYGGLDALRHPQTKVAAAEPVARRVAGMLPVSLPDDTAQLVRINGAVQVGAGLMLGFGILPRWSALALATTLPATTLAGHRFWEQEDAGAKAVHRVQFLKNVSMFGGLLIAAADTSGNPSVAWRARAASRRTRRQAGRTAAQAQALAERTLASVSDSLGALPGVSH